MQEVVTALGDGVDQAAAVRIFAHHPSTIARWLRRAGQLDQPLHVRFFSNFVAEYIQLDELKTKTRRLISNRLRELSPLFYALYRNRGNQSSV